MYREQISGDWEREPVFACGGATMPDGTVMAYFCHIVHQGDVVATAFTDQVGDGAWIAWVEVDGDEFHTMREPYPTYREALDDVVSWYVGQ